MFFLTDRNDLLQIVALVCHQALFETIIDSGIASLNGVKTHIHAMVTNFLNTQNFVADDSLVFVAQSARCWVGRLLLISSAGSMQAEAFFLHVTTRLR